MSGQRFRGQVFFRRRDRFVACAAQRDGDAAGGVDELPRRERAVGADHRTPGLFKFLYSYGAVVDGLAHFIKYLIYIIVHIMLPLLSDLSYV